MPQYNQAGHFVGVLMHRRTEWLRREARYRNSAIGEPRASRTTRAAANDQPDERSLHTLFGSAGEPRSR